MMNQSNLPTLHRGVTPIARPYSLTPKALKMARGQVVIGMSEEDWDSYLEWEARCDIIEPILNDAFAPACNHEDHQ